VAGSILIIYITYSNFKFSILEVSMYMDVCNSLDIRFFDVRTANGADVMDAAGKSYVFMDRLFEKIDRYL